MIALMCLSNDGRHSPRAGMARHWTARRGDGWNSNLALCRAGPLKGRPSFLSKARPARSGEAGFLVIILRCGGWAFGTTALRDRKDWTF
jgi:hypothetical protein